MAFENHGAYPFPLENQKFFFGGHNVHVLVPAAGPVHAAYKGGKIAFPYWSQVWPSALALSTFLVNHTTLIEGKSVLELGAGLGLPSLLAAQYAALVFCSDYEPLAVALIEESAKLNQLVNLQALQLDWRQLPEEMQTDVLLLSDVNYEASFFPQLYALLQRFLNAGTIIVLATPQRLAAKPLIERLEQDRILDEELVIPFQGASVVVSVLVLKRDAEAN